MICSAFSLWPTWTKSRRPNHQQSLLSHRDNSASTESAEHFLHISQGHRVPGSTTLHRSMPAAYQATRTCTARASGLPRLQPLTPRRTLHRSAQLSCPWPQSGLAGSQPHHVRLGRLLPSGAPQWAAGAQMAAEGPSGGLPQDAGGPGQEGLILGWDVAFVLVLHLVFLIMSSRF